MRVASLNVGTITGKRMQPFFQWIGTLDADLVCLQSTGADAQGFPRHCAIDGYRLFADHFEATGRTGVAIYSRAPVKISALAICDHTECRGRYLEVETGGGIRIASVYVRSGGKPALNVHWRQHLQCVAARMKALSDMDAIVVGDFNLAVDAADLYHNTPASQYGYTTAERRLYKDLMATDGWIDVFRHLNPGVRRYSRWAKEAEFPEKGWRIDYQWASRPLSKSLRRAEIIIPAAWDDRFSDHAVTTGDYDVA
jgi:exodeoxyribonuclease-3